MSYKHLTDGDMLSNYFSELNDFHMLKDTLWEAKNIDEFEIRLDKLAAIDKRALLLYLRESRARIPRSYMPLIRLRFRNKEI